MVDGRRRVSVSDQRVLYPPNSGSARTALFFTDPGLGCNLYISDHIAMRARHESLASLSNCIGAVAFEGVAMKVGYDRSSLVKTKQDEEHWVSVEQVALALMVPNLVSA